MHKLLATIALSVTVGTIALGGLADAQARVATGNDKSIPAASVDASRGLTLEVRKQPRNPNDDVPSGEKPDGGVAGLTFTLFRAEGIDVTTPEGRKEAARERTQQEFDALEAIEVASGTTGENGKVLFTELKPGLYRLEESAPNDNYDWRLSSPRWLVLPFGDVTGQQFTYDNVVVVKPAPKDPPTTPPPATPPADRATPPPAPPVLTTGHTPPSTPSSPAPSNPPEQPHEDTPGKVSRGGLASTGASVLWITALGALLIVLGLWMSRKRENND
ncbi:SpaA isopeptide-forming pilin-related protein [Corynebacterium mayonis]|uniref:SpaA isopeptide-forming pilin-related protein n=1 Tax=Corynebacterium mayonis TaxID=3062461 RepID=UPI0031401623